uniref:Uncharacterized protein n=1 Tax=Trypanosoma congolense (strain IL3000) TaxID=1068625 RepID=G0US55_TRYCI|nr:hypothetical protein, unlikely [Trypanosoma congolense IL3000]
MTSSHNRHVAKAMGGKNVTPASEPSRPPSPGGRHIPTVLSITLLPESPPIYRLIASLECGECQQIPLKMLRRCEHSRDPLPPYRTELGKKRSFTRIFPKNKVTIKGNVIVSCPKFLLIPWTIPPTCGKLSLPHRQTRSTTRFISAASN